MQPPGWLRLPVRTVTSGQGLITSPDLKSRDTTAARQMLISIGNHGGRIRSCSICFVVITSARCPDQISSRIEGS